MASPERNPRSEELEEDRAPAFRRIAGYLADGEAGRFDRLVYERVRLGILSALAVEKRMAFGDLKDLLQTTDGNLSVHARKLEEAGYLRCIKRFEGRVPRTEYELTGAGREALGRYLDHMEALIEATRGA
ncbi:MAG: transcriptional regulator [Thermoanaerobaculia bacterium]